MFTSASTITVNQGEAYIGGNFAGNEKFNGYISKVMFYNKALTQSEINNYFREFKIIKTKFSIYLDMDIDFQKGTIEKFLMQKLIVN